MNNQKIESVTIYTKRPGLYLVLLGLFCFTCVNGQNTYLNIKKANDAVQLYKNGDYHVTNSSTPYYLSSSQSEKFTESMTECTYFCWDAGLIVNYDINKYSYATSNAFKVKGNRNRPTGSTLIKITKNGIAIETFNDVLYNTEFYKDTGAPKKPEDPYSIALNCKNGQNAINSFFVLKGKVYKCYGKSSCSHYSQKIVVDQSGKMTHKVTGAEKNISANTVFISPWKFMHKMNLFISFDEMAKSAGISRQQLLKEIVSDNKFKIYTDYYKFWRDEVYNNVLVYSISKQEHYNIAQLKQECEKDIEMRINSADSYFQQAKNAVKQNNRALAVELLGKTAEEYHSAVTIMDHTAQRSELLELFFSVKIAQTTNAYRLLKEGGAFQKIFDDNLSFFKEIQSQTAIPYHLLMESIGIVAVEIRNYDDAIKYLKNAIIIGGKDIDDEGCHVALADAYIGMGNKREALSTLQYIQAKYPQNKRLLELRKKVAKLR